MKLINAAPQSFDDRSNQKERLLIGVIGLLLPVTLYLLAAWRPELPAARWQLLPSISAYYYTGAVAAFVGLLFALAIFLFAYQGYSNRWHLLDVLTARIAAGAALAVAFFPTGKPEGYPDTPWWQHWMEYVHSSGAAVLFCSFAFFALYLFRRTDAGDADGRRRTTDKRHRDTIYLACGIAIVAAIVWACTIGLLNYFSIDGSTDRPIFWPECMALISFAISWLTKGRVDEVRLVPSASNDIAPRAPLPVPSSPPSP